MKTKTLNVGGRVIVTVLELTADKIADGLDIFNEIKSSGDLENDVNLPMLIGKYRTILTMLDSMLSFDNTDNDEDEHINTVGQLAISELAELLEAVKEVNSTFLELLRDAGLDITELWEKSAN